MVELNDWITIIGAIGGSSTLTWVITFFANRKTNARKEDAAADAAENENERKQIAWLEERIAQRDTKIDCLYNELRQEQRAKLEEIHKRYNVELQLKDAEYNRCEMPDNECSRRIPPRRRISFIKKEEKNDESID